MKKGLKKTSLAVLLVFTLGILLAGCGGGAGDADKAGDQTGEKVKAGFIYIGSANDGGYSQVHDEGRVEMIANIGEDKVETIVQEEVPEDKTVEEVMNNMIDQGANIIFANSYGYQQYEEKVAKAHPDVKFMHFSGSILGDNYGNYFGRMYQPRYLTGIAAGMTTQNNKIGFVAAMPTPEVVRAVNEIGRASCRERV